MVFDVHGDPRGPAGLEQPRVVAADAERGAADRGGVRVTGRGLDTGAVTGGEEHADPLRGGPQQVGVLDVQLVDRDRLVRALPGVRRDLRERVVAAAVEDRRVRVEQRLQAEEAVVAGVTADNELPRERRQGIRRLDVELLLDVEGVAARRSPAERQLGVPAGGRGLDAVGGRVILQRLEHVRCQAELNQGDGHALADVVPVIAVGRPELVGGVAADLGRETGGAVLPRVPVHYVVLQVPLRAGERDPLLARRGYPPGLRGRVARPDECRPG